LSTIAFGSDQGLLLRTKAQLIVFCFIRETKIVVEFIFLFVTSQYAIIGQFQKEITLQKT